MTVASDRQTFTSSTTSRSTSPTNPLNTAKLSSPILLPRTVSYDVRTNPPRGGVYRNMGDPKSGKRRRSSSILGIYQEPQEPIEQLSDQSALPNLNAQWVNAKGKDSPRYSLLMQRSCSRHHLPPLSTQLASPRANLWTSVSNRGVDYTHCLDTGLKSSLGCGSRCFAGDVLDINQHMLHVRILPDVPLRPWCAV